MRRDTYLTRHLPDPTWHRCRDCRLAYPCPKAVEDLSYEDFTNALDFVKKCIADYERANGPMPEELRRRYLAALNGDRTRLLPVVVAQGPGAAGVGRPAAPAQPERWQR